MKNSDKCPVCGRYMTACDTYCPNCGTRHEVPMDEEYDALYCITCPCTETCNRYKKKFL